MKKPTKQKVAHEPIKLLLSLIIIEGMKDLENITGMSSAACLLCQNSSNSFRESLLRHQARQILPPERRHSCGGLNRRI